MNATVLTGGQVILPKSLCADLYWIAGRRLTVEQADGSVLLKPATTVFAPTRPEDVFGCLSFDSPAKSLEQVDAGIASEIIRPDAGSRYWIAI